MVRADLYYDKDGVKVTSKEFILNSSRYKLSDVNAVYVSKRANYRRYPITFGVLSFFFGLLMVGESMGVALFFFLCGLIMLIVAIRMKTQYALRLRIGWGETIPLISTDPYELEEIRKAIWTSKNNLEEEKEKE
ncbi:DUF6232 family protein [Phocaeicola sp.]|uniref:DUF6232 family protein n=1 Tax=Phocaeicola sp. TaxID=2773926 RepID=UPI0038660EFB